MLNSLKIYWLFFTRLLNDERGEIDSDNVVTDAPNTTDETASNTEGEQDYFTSHELVDDDGNSLSETDDPNQQAVSKEDKTVTKDKVADSKGEDKQETPQGFERKFYNESEKGEITFDGESAANFIFSDSEKSTHFKQAELPALIDKKPEDPNTPVDNTPAWKKELESNRQYGDDLLKQLNNNMTLYRKARDAGYGEQESEAYALQETKKYFEEHMAEKRFENEVSHREKLENNNKSSESDQMLKQKAAANESVFHAEIGGRDEFNKFMFGYQDNKGIMHPGVGTKDVEALFKIAHMFTGELDKPMTGEERNDKLQKFWLHLSSQQDLLAYTFAKAKGTMLMEPSFRKNLIDNIRNKANNQAVKNRSSIVQNTRLAPKTQTGGAPSTIDQFLDPMGAGEVATV